MSYILDALKKVEHEKLKKSSPGGMTNIAGDLFREQSQLPAKAGHWKIVVLLAVASFITFAGTWFMLRDNKSKNTSILSSAGSSLAVPVLITPNLPVTAPAPVVKVVAPISSLQLSSAESPDHDVRQPKGLKRTLKQPAPATGALLLKSSSQSVPPLSDIKLSGIAWQDQRSARRAVVNGFLLKEGAVISGARISEIMADRVLFALPGGIFEIRLDSVPVGEVRR